MQATNAEPELREVDAQVVVTEDNLLAVHAGGDVLTVIGNQIDLVDAHPSPLDDDLRDAYREAVHD